MGKRCPKLSPFCLVLKCYTHNRKLVLKWLTTSIGTNIMYRAKLLCVIVIGGRNRHGGERESWKEAKRDLNLNFKNARFLMHEEIFIIIKHFEFVRS